MSQDKERDQKRELTASVRELVEYVLRSGDLKLTFFSAERSAQGIRIHQLIQEARPVEYTPEVPVRHVVENRDYLLYISGRIDGVYDDGQRVVIDEIKTTRRDRSIIQEEDDPIDWGQAKCYAYIYAIQN
ncbi:MAG: ATP-dependent DNA helicase, partial [candidate division WOR-3 bacterium]